ncbi:MAG: MarR family transcriptional regulator [Reichenbachiella sp.]
MEQLKLSNQVCFPLYSVSRLITKAYKPYLDDMGLTYPQYLVMMVLWENDNLTVNQISDQLLLETNTLSPLLKRMEKMELLQRKRSVQDERRVMIQLKGMGKGLKAKAASIPEKLLNVLLTEKVGLSEVKQLKGMLDDWIDILSNSNKKLDKTDSKNR